MSLPIIRPVLGPEEQAAAAAAIESGWVAQGPRVAEFERAFADRVDAPDAVALSSCTAALHLALVCLDVGPGDEVVVPSLSFVATANAARYVGARPRFADVDLATQNVTAATVEAALSDATRAVIVVHQGGVPADLEPIHALAADRGVAVVEDAACAAGSTYRGRPIGGHSDLVAFSFHPRKLITTGEGGMLTMRRPEWAARARRLREHGMDLSAAERARTGTAKLEQYLETGFNYRMTDIQAAIGLVQLERLDAIVEERRGLAARYQKTMTDAFPEALTAADPDHGTTNFQSFWVLLPPGIDRNRVLTDLLAEGIGARRGIMASHLEPAYVDEEAGPLPITERLTHGSLLLPLFSGMTDADVERVVDTLVRACAKG